MAVIVLNTGSCTVVDDSDVPLTNDVLWVAGNFGGKTYAIGWSKSLKRSIYLHRILMSAKQGQVVDHKNGDTLDNRRENLRICNYTQNNGNSRHAKGASGFRGVERSTSSQKFRAAISIAKKRKHLGVAETAEQAARIYDMAAKAHFGEFATLNFPDVLDQDFIAGVN